ncbi:MAG: hypothetical protein KAI16_03455 [Candidatus Pacebacteria bacterium]|nr:hypothetical protein [Candidatus Paceibacterota bacterium]
MNEFKKNILEKIKKGEVEKKSPFYFIVKNYFFWVMFGFSIVIGSIAFSSFLIHFIIEPGPWHQLKLEQNNFSYIFKSLPILWLVLIIIFILAGWFNYKHTKKSYKRHNFLIIAISVIISLIFGVLLFFSGMGKNIDKRMQNHIPEYGRYSEERMEARKAFLESQGLDPEEFIKYRQIRKFRNQMK